MIFLGPRPSHGGFRVCGLAWSTYYRGDATRAQAVAAADAALRGDRGDHAQVPGLRLGRERRRRGARLNHKRVARLMRDCTLAVPLLSTFKGALEFLCNSKRR